MTEKATNCGQDLHEAFHAFSEMSERLTASYRILEKRVAVLTQGSAAAPSEQLEQIAEKERRANRRQQLLDTIPGAIVVLDGNDVIQEYNSGAVELLGEPLLDETWRDIAKKAIARLSGDGYFAILSDGRQVAISSRVLDSEPGRILLLKDETETRRLQEMLNRHQRLSAISEKVARLVRQICTPLASAMLHVPHLCKPQGDARAATQYAEKALAGLRQLERMVDDMLVFTRSGGTGLGLAVVRAIVQGHQGEIPVRSSAGAGTIFSTRPPISQGDSLLAGGLWRNHHLPMHGSLGNTSHIAECQ